MFATIDFEERECILAVDFVARRVKEVTLLHVSLKTCQTLDVLETEVADVDAGNLGQFDRVRGEVPRFDAVLA